MALLNKDAILTADDLTSEDVEVPEWGGTVRLRALTGTERDDFEASCVGEEKNGKPSVNAKNIRARLVARCCVGEDGQRLFTDAEVTKLGMKSGRALDRLWDAARRLSGMSDDDVEELAGNSEPAPSGLSISG
jgi:hypothetical protein